MHPHPRYASVLRNQWEVHELHAVDAAYHATPAGQVGPLEAHLLDSLSYKGLVFGGFGETSSHVKGLLLVMAARAQQVGRLYRGGKCIPQEIALLYIATLSTGSRFMLAKQCRGFC